MCSLQFSIVLNQSWCPHWRQTQIKGCGLKVELGCDLDDNILILFKLNFFPVKGSMKNRMSVSQRGTFQGDENYGRRPFAGFLKRWSKSVLVKRICEETNSNK